MKNQTKYYQRNHQVEAGSAKRVLIMLYGCAIVLFVIFAVAGAVVWVGF